MKQFTIEAYGTTVRVYEYHVDENIKIMGVGPEPVEMKDILTNSEFCFKEARTASSVYGFGFNDNDINYVILADGIDEKQLSNLFISVGATEGYVVYEDISGIEVIEVNSLSLSKINADVVDTAYLGTKDNRIVAGTITTEDLIKEVQAPVTKPKAKKSTRK